MKNIYRIVLSAVTIAMLGVAPTTFAEQGAEEYTFIQSYSCYAKWTIPPVWGWQPDQEVLLSSGCPTTGFNPTCDCTTPSDSPYPSTLKVKCTMQTGENSYASQYEVTPWTSQGAGIRLDYCQLVAVPLMVPSQPQQ